MSPDLSAAINERALLHIDNAYYISDIEVTNYLCKNKYSKPQLHLEALAEIKG